MENLKIATREDKKFLSLWEEFCTGNKMPVYFSLPWLDFCKNISRENFLKDLSFLIIRDDLPVAIVPLIMERGMYGNQFSVRNKYMLRAPAVSFNLSDKLRKKIQKQAFCYIEEIAHTENASLHMVLIDPMFIIEQKFAHNYLLEFNYLDCSILTNIIDLEAPRSFLWSNLRKSFKSLIRKEAKVCNTLIVDCKNISRELFSEFSNLYFLASGKRIYDDLEWNILCEMIKQDQGMLILAELNHEIIGGYYFNHSHGKVYYSLSANHPQYEKTYFIGHLLIWRSIEYYLSRDFKWLELGWQFYGKQLLENPTDKEINISYFKRGFGGFNFPLYRGVRFFNDEAKNEFIQKNLSI